MLIRQLDVFNPLKIRKLRANSNSNSNSTILNPPGGNPRTVAEVALHATAVVHPKTSRNRTEDDEQMSQLMAYHPPIQTRTSHFLVTSVGTVSVTVSCVHKAASETAPES